MLAGYLMVVNLSSLEVFLEEAILTISMFHVYDTNGWIRDLPSLNLARSDHACASFLANGKRVSPNSFEH